MDSQEDKLLQESRDLIEVVCQIPRPKDFTDQWLEAYQKIITLVEESDIFKRIDFEMFDLVRLRNALIISRHYLYTLPLIVRIPLGESS